MTFAGPEQKFGIQVQSRKAPRTFEQNVSMILAASTSSAEPAPATA